MDSPTGWNGMAPDVVQATPVDMTALKSFPDETPEDVAATQLGDVSLSSGQVGDTPDTGLSYIDDYDFYFSEPPPAPSDDYVFSLDEPPLNYAEDTAVTDASNQQTLSPQKIPVASSEQRNPDVPEPRDNYMFSLDDPPIALAEDTAASDVPNQLPLESSEQQTPDVPESQDNCMFSIDDSPLVSAEVTAASEVPNELSVPLGSLELRKAGVRELQPLQQHECIVTGVSRQEPRLEESIRHEDLLHIQMEENVEKEEIIQGDLLPVLSNDEVMLSLRERSTEERQDEPARGKPAQQVDHQVSPEEETSGDVRFEQLPELNIHGEDLPSDTVQEDDKVSGGENVVVRYLQDDNVGRQALLEAFKRELSRGALSREVIAVEEDVHHEKAVKEGPVNKECSVVKRSENTSVAKDVPPNEQVAGTESIAATPAEEPVLESGFSKEELLKILNMASKLRQARVAYKNVCQPATVRKFPVKKKPPSVLRLTGRTRKPDPKTNGGVCAIGKGTGWEDSPECNWGQPLPKEIADLILAEPPPKTPTEALIDGESCVASSSKRFPTISRSPLYRNLKTSISPSKSNKSCEPVTLSDSDEELPDYSVELGLASPKTEPVEVEDCGSNVVDSVAPKLPSPACTVIDSDDELPDYSVELGLARPKTQVQSSRKSVEVVVDGNSCTVVHSMAPRYSPPTCTLNDSDEDLPDFSLEVDLSSRKTDLWKSVEVVVDGDSCTVVRSAAPRHLAPTTMAKRKRRPALASRPPASSRNRNRDHYEVVTLESSDDSDDADLEVLKISKKTSPKKAPAPEKPKPPPQASDSGSKNEWCCPICLETKDKVPNMMSTICGHLFCGPCLQSTIKINKQCPNCRKKLTLRQIHFVYM